MTILVPVCVELFKMSSTVTKTCNLKLVESIKKTLNIDGIKHNLIDYVFIPITKSHH